MNGDAGIVHQHAKPARRLIEETLLLASLRCPRIGAELEMQMRYVLRNICYIVEI
jgi:hypothetical protein